MPITEISLSNAIENAFLQTKNLAITGASGDAIIKLQSQLLAKAIIDELKNNAVVIGVCPPTGGPLLNGKIT